MLSDETNIQFQFTHPGRGATEVRRATRPEVTVSIHAPREGCDKKIHRHPDKAKEFQFTHPGRGATNRMQATRI